MKRDTKRLQFLLEGAQEMAKAVRAEIESGVGLEHVYQDYRRHEQIFASRLRDVQEWNARQEAETPVPSEAPPTPPVLSTTPPENVVNLPGASAPQTPESPAANTPSEAAAETPAPESAPSKPKRK